MGNTTITPTEPVKGFGKLERWVLTASADLRPIELRVLLSILFHASPGRPAYLKKKTIGAELGITAKRVGVGLKGLRERGLVEIKQRSRFLEVTITPGSYFVGPEIEPQAISWTPKSEPPQVQGAPEPEPPSVPMGVRVLTHGGSGFDPMGVRVLTHGGSGSGAPIEQTHNRPIKQTHKQTPKVSEEAPELFTLEPPKDKPDRVRELFDAWREATGKNRARLDKDRTRDLKKALIDWGFETAMKAIQNVVLDDFAMGRSDPERYRGNPTTYNEPRHIFTKAERTEYFLGLESEQQYQGPNVDELYSEWMNVFTKVCRRIDLTEPVDGIIRIRDQVIPVTGDVLLDRLHVLRASVQVTAEVTAKQNPAMDFISEREVRSSEEAIEEYKSQKGQSDGRSNQGGNRSRGQSPSGSEAVH